MGQKNEENSCGGQFYFYYYYVLLVGPTEEPVIERDKNNVRNVICLLLCVKHREMKGICVVQFECIFGLC